MIFSSHDFDEMTNEERRDMLDRMGREIFGTEQFGSLLAECVGMTRQTVNNWRRDNPPSFVLALLSYEIAIRDDCKERVMRRLFRQ